MKTTVRNALLVGLLFAPIAPDATASPEDTIDEVTIEAARANLAKLAQEVKVAERRFYARYNELNTTRDYAVNCEDEASTGSRFTLNSCQPVFQQKALREQRRDLREGGTAGAAVSSAVAAALPGFQKNMADITRKNPDLLELLSEYGALAKQYEDASRKVNGSKSSIDAASPAAAAPSRKTSSDP